MFNEPFDLQSIIMEATNLYKYEAERKGLAFELDLSGSPRMVVGDSSKIKTVVANLTANARKRLLTLNLPFFPCHLMPGSCLVSEIHATGFHRRVMPRV
jgi:hypothetical protein